MTDAHDHDQVGHEQIAKLQIGRRFEQAAHGEIEIARFDELEQLDVEADVKLHLRRRALHEEARKDRLGHQARHEVPGADPDLADLAGAQLFDLPFRIVERDPGHFRSRPQRGADRRQLDPAGRADEQLGAKVGFQPLQAPRQRRLTDAQGFRRAREIPRLADGEEVLEFPIQQRHAQKLSECVFLSLEHIGQSRTIARCDYGLPSLSVKDQGFRDSRWWKAMRPPTCH